MSVSRLLVPKVQPAWMKSTDTAVSVLQDTLDLVVRSVSTMSLNHPFILFGRFPGVPWVHREEDWPPSLFLLFWNSPLSSPVIGLGKSCRHAGLQFPHGSRWDEECNACQCVNGNVHCSKVRLTATTVYYRSDNVVINLLNMVIKTSNTPIDWEQTIQGLSDIRQSYQKMIYLHGAQVWCSVRQTIKQCHWRSMSGVHV